ncbi:hypothetical protein Sme01_04700 [Sphaerisporangium melleum]|uniref:Uncharacterized protein n=1 Tax=Sphaerisporangium melleum TaxID=321316 RepID=A0A917VBX3_9ACTN|nr:hypothetical protein GCM10007964_02250 [Sphaerisporangium melleum]GII67994.1 hypothetical protein Sme01_04700 [Sphaerisporangium melleum]
MTGRAGSFPLVRGVLPRVCALTTVSGVPGVLAAGCGTLGVPSGVVVSGRHGGDALRRLTVFVHETLHGGS